ncbi:possible replication factor-a protein [Aspergillus fumigatus A1163]|uniref:Possible replication factor-a protein n=2 Tax=Aspergillus fumigatus TaxID=746128 RepID=Q4WM55_ASPFU|nr:possible replication factor-a protein [Aspergillus fumigatus Af293]EAL88959.1 possible replication factor-a protein [Aspergillus fumigatus Af293]EDP49685.1 possible replication factor-a protein [Aspergillus fumigatus A1163]
MPRDASNTSRRDGGYTNYGNTSYGGGGGGGFMPGEMNSPAGGKGDNNNATLRPITVKQALDASQPYPEAAFQIDGADAASVCFIGQVRNISSQSTNVTYKIDDGTGEIEVKQWIDTQTADTMETDDGKAGTGKNQVELNGFAKVFGKIKSFGNKRYVGAHCVRPTTNLNEVHCHLLEAAAIHLFFTRGPPGGGAAGGASGAGANADAAMGGANDYGTGNSNLPAMSPAARRVYNLLKTEPQSNEGLHAQLIAAKLNLPMPDVARAGEELLTAGVIFSTVDEQTWAILEY